MDSAQSVGGDGGGRGLQVEDEFACPGMLRDSLMALHGTVERIFRVTFGIGEDNTPRGNNEQIWLKLRGPSSNVKAAKLYVKGVVNQEEQQEVSYPGVLHCIFCGARGLFMDSLIRNTSAHIVIGSPGCLLMSGLTEPVALAYSLVAELVEQYQGTQSKRSDLVDRGSGETLDSRRAFKALVEDWEDRHILDLLVLPGSVKEILLNLVKESGLASSPSPGNGANSLMDFNRTWTKPSTSKQTLADPFRTADRWAKVNYDSSPKDSLFNAFTSVDPRGQKEGAEGGYQHSPQEVGEEDPSEQLASSGLEVNKDVSEEQDRQLSSGNKEFFLLLKFFTAMGYTEDVVKRVLARTGPKEASQILDLVQQEQDLCDREQNVPGASEPKDQSSAAAAALGHEQPCETEHKEVFRKAEKVKATPNNEEQGLALRAEGKAAMNHANGFQEQSREAEKKLQDEDFVREVVKKAAVSCGYNEHSFSKVYDALSDGSSHLLLPTLQKQGSKETEGSKEQPKEVQYKELKEKDIFGAKSADGGDIDILGQKEKTECFLPAGLENFPWSNKSDELTTTQHMKQPNQQQPFNPLYETVLPDVKGPPMPTYPSTLDPQVTQTFQPNKHLQTSFWYDSPPSSQKRQKNVANSKSSSPNSSKKAFPPQTNIFTGSDSHLIRTKERQHTSSVVVTGEQRFLEGLQTPFELQLTDHPGNPELRAIVIDGSNVAMSHGLGHFFSCRGIALAVQHFWDRGHRTISALVPQWRQKSDPRIKEKHFLAQLQELGLLAYTPSREFNGKRISSYDDRLILQLAQKNDGVIVTNDNLRDLSDESPVWRDIIKKRLLQYTFVGDLFMVPDDPLGRGGPHLDDFLRSEHRTPEPGNHSFAGLASTVPTYKPPRSQTEVLNFRDRTLGGAQDAPGRWGRPSRWDSEQQHGAPGQGLPAKVDRTPEETAHLREQLSLVFPGQDNVVTLVLQAHSTERDINLLSDLILEGQNN